MLRSLLIYLSKAAWARKIVTSWGVARRTALRFVAGETLGDALEVLKNLNQKSINGTIDQLGEYTKTPDESRSTAKQIVAILDAIHAAGVRSNVSIKLSQIGLLLDPALAEENLVMLLEHARELNTFLRIDMEGFECLEATFGLYWKMRREHGFDNVGMVMQSYLYRVEDDTRDLLSAQTPIRLVKGAYKESPEVAYQKKSDVDASFDRTTELLLDAARDGNAPTITADGKWPPLPAIATHDERRIAHAKTYAGQIGLPKEKMEFQMLYGIRRDLQESLAAEGYPVRVYVPFGTQWYPYYMRRLAERPANLWFFISNFFR